MLRACVSAGGDLSAPSAGSATAGFAIHLTAGIGGEADSILSRMRSTGSTGASFTRVLDRSDPLTTLAAKR